MRSRCGRSPCRTASARRSPPAACTSSSFQSTHPASRWTQALSARGTHQWGPGRRPPCWYPCWAENCMSRQGSLPQAARCVLDSRRVQRGGERVSMGEGSGRMTFGKRLGRQVGRWGRRQQEREPCRPVQFRRMCGRAGANKQKATRRGERQARPKNTQTRGAQSERKGGLGRRLWGGGRADTNEVFAVCVSEERERGGAGKRFWGRTGRLIASASAPMFEVVWFGLARLLARGRRRWGGRLTWHSLRC